MGGNVQQQKLVHQVKPVYPALAKQARIQGTVRFNVIIDKEGRVANVGVVSGHPLLIAAAIDAVKQWQYQPTLLNGEPVAVSTVVDVNFTLNEPYDVALSTSGLTVGQPKALNTVEPVYPPLAKQARIQGTVHLRAVIGKDGRVESVQPVSGHPLLIPAATEAVKQWVYQPAVEGGQPAQAVANVTLTFSLPNEEAAQTPTGAPMRIRVGGNVQQAKRDHFVQPTYPPLAKQSGIEGTVVLNVTIDKDGNVQTADVVTGHPLLIPAAIDAVKQWTYKTTLLNGNPVEVVTTVEVNFRLQD